MKFGRNLSRNQVPEWASAYINYKGLKKLVKSAAEAARDGQTVDLAEFFFALDRNLEDVDSFYNKKFSETFRRLKKLQDRYGSAPEVTAADLDDDEIEELMGAILELRGQLRNLLWFGEINRRGFVKITKKLDKKVPNTATQHRYIVTKVDPRPFATNTALQRPISEANKWLQVLGDASKVDDSMSDRSARSLGRATAKAMNLSAVLLDKLDQAIRKDNVTNLRAFVEEARLELADPATQGLLLNLLQRSISSRSKASIEFLLRVVKSLDEPDDINGRNCIHRLVIHIGRTKSASSPDNESSSNGVPPGTPYASQFLTPAATHPVTPRPSNTKESTPLDSSEQPVQILKYLLEHLQPRHQSALSARDSFGRLPLHYAAQFGFVVVCQILMAKMQEWLQFDVKNGIDALEWQDFEGLAPLHLSVIGGHALTTKALLQGEDWQGIKDNKEEARRKITKSSEVLAIATKHNHENIVRMLVDAGVDINWQDGSGEAALHIAARFGHEMCAAILLEGTDAQKADLELAEISFAWTPLHIAAVDGHFGVAQLLAKAGADVEKPDSSGWTAREHADLRGHLPIAKLLEGYYRPALGGVRPLVGTPSTAGTSPPETSSSLGDRRSNGKAEPLPVRTYGHRYLKDETLVLVSLGSMDMRKNVQAVELDKVPLTEAHHTQLDTALSVVVSANFATGEPTVIDLPVHENIATEPIAFTTKDVAKVNLYFDIVPTYSGNEKKNRVGRAIAALAHVRPRISSQRMSLQGDVCVPILAANDLEMIGSINFNFLVITPFAHSNMEVTSEQTYWKKMSSTMVIGHRGMGKNMTSNRSLQLGENTVPSFIAAANLGASYVEFDVQLTKDHIPVIYHDFLVSETGLDAPVHALTLEQFLHINPDTSREKAQDILDASTRIRSVSPGPRSRSQSMGCSGQEKRATEERMKHTRDFKAKGFKANSRGNFIQAPFATLEDLFRKLPAHVGFNIEMKYPMLHESEEQGMDGYAVELNSFCDTVLEKVYELAGPRNIIFSSFNPDICLCLSFKQPNFPVMFLTDAGGVSVGDVRASSLQEAIRFARRWNLLGIVSLAEPFVSSPRLVRVVKQNGLVCVSYGVQNNNPSLVERQVKEGIDAVIVDNVLAIRQGLTNEVSKAAGNA